MGGGAKPERPGLAALFDKNSTRSQRHRHPPPPPSTLPARHFVPTAGRWYNARGEVPAPLQARTTPAPIAHGAGLPGRPRGEPSESGDGSSSSGWETVEEEEEDPG